MTTQTPTTPPSEDFIRYDLLTQKALRGVVRDVLSRVAREGTPGEHHFYLSFRTTDVDVRMSSRLRERYPTEMTVILQHQFWDLNVTDHAFEVGLSFGGVPERLLVPFESLTSFYDPSVQFGLKFDTPESLDDVVDAAAETTADAKLPTAGNASSAGAPDAPASPEGGAEVVSLDKFRKK